MLLSAFIRTVYVPSRISLSTRYVQSLNEVACDWSVYLGRPAFVRDFDELAIASFLASLAQTQPATSVNSYRRRLLTLWEYAAAIAMIDRPPRRKQIRILPEELDPPEAWDEDQVSDLMVAVAGQEGFVGDVPSGNWWLSLVLAIFETSCRIGSMMMVPSAAYDGEGIAVRKQKNHRPQWFRLSPTACSVIEETRPTDRRLLWSHPWHPTTIWPKFRRIVESAGLPCPKTGNQLFHRLRRSTVTLCAIVDRALAQRTAGHRDWATTEKHYICQRMMRDERCAVDVLPDTLQKVRQLRAAEGSPILYESEHPRFRIYG